MSVDGSGPLKGVGKGRGGSPGSETVPQGSKCHCVTVSRLRNLLDNWLLLFQLQLFFVFITFAKMNSPKAYTPHFKHPT